MAYTLNEEIPCRTEACTGGEHRPASACNSVYDIILDAIKEVKKDVADIDVLAKENTLQSKAAELNAKIERVESLINNLDFSILAKEKTLVDGITSLEEKIEESSSEFRAKINKVEQLAYAGL